MPAQHDVAIIGGGPAGSTTAAYLARAGIDAVVLERDTFPRFHIGESLLPYNTPIFEELGFADKLAGAGFMPKHGAKFFVADGSRSSGFRFGDGRFTEHPSAYHVERATFDKLLLDHAAGLGATVRENTRVERFDTTTDGVTLETSAGPVAAKVLVDASGQDNLTANRLGLRTFNPALRKVAVFGHFAGITLPDGAGRGDILIVRLDDAWFWFIPLAGDKVSLGLVTGPANLRDTTPQQLFDDAVARTPALADRLAGRRQLGALHTMRDFSYSNRTLASGRVVRVGDAAGFIDPIFSSGVFLAMATARLAAPAVIDTVRSGSPATAALDGYEKTVRAWMRLFTEMIEGFYTQPFIELLVQPRTRFHLPCAVNALLAGRLDHPWKIRWRLRAFHTLVKIQRRFPLVERIALPGVHR